MTWPWKLLLALDAVVLAALICIWEYQVRHELDHHPLLTTHRRKR